MNSFDFINFTNTAQISTFLFLAVVFLAYIAYKLSARPSRPARAH